MMGWPVWLRFLTINVAVPWMIVLGLRAGSVQGPAALLIVLSAAVVLLTLNIWHIRTNIEWRAGFVLLAILNPLCTFFFNNVALATSVGSLWLFFRRLVGIA